MLPGLPGLPGLSPGWPGLSPGVPGLSPGLPGLPGLLPGLSFPQFPNCKFVTNVLPNLVPSARNSNLAVYFLDFSALGTLMENRLLSVALAIFPDDTSFPWDRELFVAGIS
ncbi:hypothetical protein C1X05_09970 [Laceyella sacchari]|nr:hypothetical protein C1X05_09970 [Laceyella sacchari]